MTFVVLPLKNTLDYNAIDLVTKPRRTRARVRDTRVREASASLGVRVVCHWRAHG